MIHFLVVGTKRELMGFGNELKQTIQGIFGDENAWKSAFYEQDCIQIILALGIYKQ